MNAILDIPDASLLALFNIEDLVQLFCVYSGVERPDVICLPLYDEGGCQFESKFASAEKSMWPRYVLEKEVQKIRKKYPEVKIYLCLMPDLPGLRASHLSCRNQYGEEASGACIVNPYVQKVILDIVLDAIQKLQPEGIVFNLVEINGQSGRGAGKPVDVSCFCTHCRQAMLDWKFDYDPFMRRMSPFNLVLQATDSGIRFVTPKAHFTPEQLIDLAVKDEFISRDDEQARTWAQHILDYIKVRSKITGIAVGEMSRAIKESFPSTRVGAILNTSSFDWTGGMDMHGVAGQVDEVWLDVEDSTAATIPPGLDVLAYAAPRARYRIDAFFETASDRRFLELASRGEGVQDILARLNQRMVEVGQVQNLNRTFVDSIDKMEYLKGFVGIPYDRRLYQQIVQTVTAQINLMAGEAQEARPSTVSKDLVRKYIALLVQYREEGNELSRREIVGLAAQLDLID